MTRLMGDNNIMSMEGRGLGLLLALLRKFGNRIKATDIYFHRSECRVCQSKLTLINTASKAYDQYVFR